MGEKISKLIYIGSNNNVAVFSEGKKWYIFPAVGVFACLEVKPAASLERNAELHVW